MQRRSRGGSLVWVGARWAVVVSGHLVLVWAVLQAGKRALGRGYSQMWRCMEQIDRPTVVKEKQEVRRLQLQHRPCHSHHSSRCLSDSTQLEIPTGGVITPRYLGAHWHACSLPLFRRTPSICIYMHPDHSPLLPCHLSYTLHVSVWDDDRCAGVHTIATYASGARSCGTKLQIPLDCSCH
jgi:hypothetical protein